MKPWGHLTMVCGAHLLASAQQQGLPLLAEIWISFLHYRIRPLGLILFISSSRVILPSPWALLALILARKSDLRPSALSGFNMAEVLGVIASGIAVAQTADRVASFLGPYIMQVKHAKEEIKNLSAEVRDLGKVLEAVSSSSVGASHELDQEIERCKSTLKNIESRLDQGSPSKTRKLVSKIRSRLVWPFKSEEVKEIINQLERRKSNLSLYLSADDR